MWTDNQGKFDRPETSEFGWFQVKQVRPREHGKGRCLRWANPTCFEPWQIGCFEPREGFRITARVDTLQLAVLGKTLSPWGFSLFGHCLSPRILSWRCMCTANTVKKWCPAHILRSQNQVFLELAKSLSFRNCLCNRYPGFTLGFETSLEMDLRSVGGSNFSGKEGKFPSRIPSSLKQH